jgi:capsular exopolysaccharide synthesis family protein
LRLTPKYEASASIRIQHDESRLGDFGISGPSTPNEFPTEFQVLQSRTLAEAVVDSLGLQLEVRAPTNRSRSELFPLITGSRAALPGEYLLELQAGGDVRVQDRATGRRLDLAIPDSALNLRGVKVRLAPGPGVIALDVYSFEDAVKRLQKTLKVKRRSPEANILDVSYRGTDPRLVQAVPNVLAARFIEARQREHHAQARSTAKFLREQVEKLSGKLRDSENALRTYRMRTGVVSLPDEASSGVTRAAELQAQRNSIEAERVALAQLVRALRDSTSGNPADAALAYRNLIAFPTLLHDEAMARLLTSILAIEDRRSELLARRSPQDPDVLNLSARANQLGEQIRTMALTYLQGLTNQVAALDATLAQSRQQLDRIPEKELRFARLQRESKGLEEIVTLLQSRLKEAEIAEAVEDPSVRLVDAAVMPSKPVSPKPLVNLSLALVLGLALGAGGAFLREYMDKTVRSRREMLIATGVPVLGLLPRARRPGRWRTPLRPVSAGAKPQWPIGRNAGNARRSAQARGSRGLICANSALTLVEAYNLLDTNLAFVRPGEPTKVLTVTSPLPGEGKTTVAVNLALTLAQRGARVVLVDADLRCGTIAALFGIAQEPGLSDILLETTHFGKALHRIQVSATRDLHVISRGRSSDSPAQLLGSAQTHTLLGSLREGYDSVIVDTPPTNVVADAALVGAQSDGVIVVARSGVTEVPALAFAMDQLAHVHARVVGAVLNDIDFRRDATYDEAYSYYMRRDAYAQHST